MSKPIRYRRCPVCHTTMPANRLLYVDTLGKRNWNHIGRALRQCPECGSSGPTCDFPIVRDGEMASLLQEYEESLGG